MKEINIKQKTSQQSRSETRNNDNRPRKRTTNQRNFKIWWKIGTSNTRSMNSKEQALEMKFEKAGLDIMGLTETKKKGRDF